MSSLNFKKALSRTVAILLLYAVQVTHSQASGRQEIKALYIPLADHYAALVAYERYRDSMKYADFKLQLMPNWDLLRALFQEGDTDMAFVMGPLALDMYRQKPHFKWIGLIHRDGNGLAVNQVLGKQLDFSDERHSRKPTAKLAEQIRESYQREGSAIQVGVPHLLSTHTVALYKYLKDNNLSLSLVPNTPGHVLALAVAPPRSPSFVISKSNLDEAAAIEQSLPWIDIVETGEFGRVAWYSKDIFPSKLGHIECIVIASNNTIRDKTRAMLEVMVHIKRAGAEIETARAIGGQAIDDIVAIVQKHIPAHTRSSILASLDPHLRVINYEKLDVDIPAMKELMGVALEGGILKEAVDLNQFAIKTILGPVKSKKDK